MPETKEQITKEMTIESIFANFPQKSQKLGQELTNSGLHCVGCGAATWETLEAGMLSHGFDPDAIDDMVVRLNNILNQEIDLSTITITKRAADKYRQILSDEGKDTWSLRLGEQAAGCSGFEYVLDYSEKPTDKDKVFTSEGLEIHVHEADLSRLIGVEIDFVDGLNGSGFKITNPNVKGSCGCGKSQSY